VNRRGAAFAAVLALLALHLWLRDRAWASDPSDALVLLAGFPLFAWLGRPWVRRAAPAPAPRGPLALGAALYLVGAAVDSPLALATGWTALFWAWLASRYEGEPLAHARRLLVLPWLAFPWLLLGGARVGWVFRLTAAWVAAHAFAWAGFPVSREGTCLVAAGVPIAVDAACAGLNVLQAMGIAGGATAAVMLRGRRGYLGALALLPVLAWLANTLRVLILGGAALAAGPEFASGLFHRWGGLSVLVLMFVSSVVAFALLRRALPASP
jgi:exosortase/archaeosortase family protein